MSTDFEGRARKQRLVASVSNWWHSIDLGDGVITGGHKTPEILAAELAAMNLPSLVGKSVLDIGAWDGFFSFEAERRGAERVVALDHFVWSLQHAMARQYIQECRTNGVQVRRLEDVAHLWDYENLPGKHGFDVCHTSLNSSVEIIVDDLMTMDLADLGTFDVVLYLGVLYHLVHPLVGLQRLREVTGELAIIESEMVYFPATEDLALTEFYPNDELAADHTNWWAPNMAALIGLTRYAGFREVIVMQGPPAHLAELPAEHQPVHYRGIIHAIV